MSKRSQITVLTIAFASTLSALLYSLWSLVSVAPVPFRVVTATAAVIAIGICIGDAMHEKNPQSKLWIVPNVLSLVLSVPLALPYPFDIGMPICMVSTAVLTGRLHKVLLRRLGTISVTLC